ncbi:uncharacterized protein PG986_015074 [Apiospora aurea]|uniref:Uncharacterized protein n=1 Tax=Apiospora aurea TaxID=335848 RepID=A0ABR1PRI7_9PEZI
MPVIPVSYETSQSMDTVVAGLATIGLAKGWVIFLQIVLVLIFATLEIFLISGCSAAWAQDRKDGLLDSRLKQLTTKTKERATLQSSIPDIEKGLDRALEKAKYVTAGQQSDAASFITARRQVDADEYPPPVSTKPMEFLSLSFKQVELAWSSDRPICREPGMFPIHLNPPSSHRLLRKPPRASTHDRTLPDCLRWSTTPRTLLVNAGYRVPNLPDLYSNPNGTADRPSRSWFFHQSPVSWYGRRSSIQSLDAGIDVQDRNTTMHRTQDTRHSYSSELPENHNLRHNICLPGDRTSFRQPHVFRTNTY